MQYKPNAKSNSIENINRSRMPPHYPKLFILVYNVAIGTTMATNRLIQMRSFRAFIVHWLVDWLLSVPSSECTTSLVIILAEFESKILFHSSNESSSAGSIVPLVNRIDFRSGRVWSG